MLELLQGYYYVYIVTNPEKILLDTGVTGDLVGRIKRLKDTFYFDQLKDVTIFSCFHLVHWEKYEDVQAAMKRADEIKKLSLKKKCNLVQINNPEWHFLNETVDKPINRNKYY